MKEYLNPVVLFMTQGKMVLILTIFWVWGWNPKMFTIHAKAVKQYLNPVVLFIMQYKVVLTFESADKILGCGAVTFSQNLIWEYFRFEQGHSWENTKVFTTWQGIDSTYLIKYCTVIKDKTTVTNKLIEGLIVCEVLCLELGTDIRQIHWMWNHFVVIRNLKEVKTLLSIYFRSQINSQMHLMD